ncbi:MAG: (2Fe-2S)-binding protein, partial [Pusillimonas sp.]
LGAYLLAGDTRAADALLQWADSGEAPAPVSQILMGRGVAATRARIVCTCASVSDTALMAAIESGQDLEALKASLKCGVTCGSCLPQIKRMLEHAHSTEPHA